MCDLDASHIILLSLSRTAKYLEACILRPSTFAVHISNVPRTCAESNDNILFCSENYMVACFLFLQPTLSGKSTSGITTDRKKNNQDQGELQKLCLPTLGGATQLYPLSSGSSVTFIL